MNSLKFMPESCRTARCPRLGCTQQTDSVSLSRSWALAVPWLWVSSGLASGSLWAEEHVPLKMNMNFQGQSTQFQSHTWRAVDGSARVTPLWVTTDLYWHGLTLQRTVLAPTQFWLQICHQRGNESFSLPFANLPLLTGGWLTCFIRKRSVPKCRSCRKDSSGAVKSVQPGCSWIQFLWPANSSVAIYSEVRFLMSGVSILFCLQGIWQSKKQLLRTAQMLLQSCGG